MQSLDVAYVTHAYIYGYMVVSDHPRWRRHRLKCKSSTKEVENVETHFPQQYEETVALVEIITVIYFSL